MRGVSIGAHVAQHIAQEQIKNACNEHKEANRANILFLLQAVFATSRELKRQRRGKEEANARRNLILKKTKVSLDESAKIEVETKLAEMDMLQPTLERLQTAIKAARDADVVLASGCYRSDVWDTINELSAYFEEETRVKQR